MVQAAGDAGVTVKLLLWVVGRPSDLLAGYHPVKRPASHLHFLSCNARCMVDVEDGERAVRVGVGVGGGGVLNLILHIVCEAAVHLLFRTETPRNIQSHVLFNIIH